MNAPRLQRLLTGCLFAALLSPAATAYESDQFLYREVIVADALEPLDNHVNAALDQLIADWTGEPDERRLARAIYRVLGGIYWVDRIEFWADRSPDVARYPHTRYRNIYRGMPFWATRVNFLFGVGPTYRINGVMVGSDKLGHFVSQGYKYYKRHKRQWAEDRLLARGAFAERWIFGQLTTGVYANADLVANYEGYLFFRGLFEDGIVGGKPALFAWRDGKPVRQRNFTFADHINDFWDEALNPSFLVASLDKRLRPRIIALCDRWRRNPGIYDTSRLAALWDRYEHIGLKDARKNRLDRICTSPAAPQMADRNRPPAP